MAVEQFFSIKLLGFLMNSHNKPARPDFKPQTSFIDRQRNMPRRVGNMTAIMLEKNLINTDRLWGARKDAQIFVGNAFGKTPYGVQPEGVIQ